MSNQVASETLRQMGGSKRLSMFVGAKDFVASETALLFGWKAKSKNKANKVKIDLNGNDLYDVTFFRVWGTNIKEISKHTDQYNDMLVNLFETETGLFLHF